MLGQRTNPRERRRETRRRTTVFAALGEGAKADESSLPRFGVVGAFADELCAAMVRNRRLERVEKVEGMFVRQTRGKHKSCHAFATGLQKEVATRLPRSTRTVHRTDE